MPDRFRWEVSLLISLLVVSLCKSLTDKGLFLQAVGSGHFGEMLQNSNYIILKNSWGFSVTQSP